MAGSNGRDLAVRQLLHDIEALKHDNGVLERRQTNSERRIEAIERKVYRRAGDD